MNCLCCGKALDENTENCWHKRCIRKFFGTETLPDLNISEEVIQSLARKSVEHGLSVPGVQKKLSLHLFSKNDNPRLTIVDYPSGYILKPASDRYLFLPEAEYLTMQMAQKAGIQVVPHALLKQKEGFAYITRRIDREEKKGIIKKYAMEDFCQLDQRLTQDKYQGSYERCAKIIKKYSSRRGIDLSEFYVRIIFCFLSGNSDMHLKNFSLIENGDGYILSPAYDLLAVNIILPEDMDECALTLHGKKKNIRKKDFYELGEQCELRKETCEKLIQRQLKNVPVFLQMIDESYLSNEMKERFELLVKQRADVLE